MTPSLLTTNRFKRDLKRIKRRNKDLEKHWRIVSFLLEDEPLPAKHHPHNLTGEWVSFRECHIEPDWLLIWRETEESIVLVRTGTHADLFG